MLLAPPRVTAAAVAPPLYAPLRAPVSVIVPPVAELMLNAPVLVIGPLSVTVPSAWTSPAPLIALAKS